MVLLSLTLHIDSIFWQTLLFLSQKYVTDPLSESLLS